MVLLHKRVEMPRPLAGSKLAIYIDKLATRPDLRGEGLGSALVTHAAAVARRQQLPLVLHVRESNVRAFALYRRLGFDHVGSQGGLYTNGERARVMVNEAP